MTLQVSTLTKHLIVKYSDYHKSNSLMKNHIALITLLTVSILSACSAQITQPEASEVWEPEPRVVEGVSSTNHVPSDAIILLGKQGLSEWKSRKTDGEAEWNFDNGVMTVNAGTGDIKTKKQFGSVQLHMEWRAPQIVEGEGQGRGNSGIFFMERYEVQILDSYQNRTYSNGQAGAIYKQYMPLVNAMNPTNEWQTYDIIFEAPVFNDDGVKVRSAYLTVLHNGVLIQNHREVLGTTEYIGFPQNKAHDEASLMIQDHGNPVSFRNIWVRKL